MKTTVFRAELKWTIEKFGSKSISKKCDEHLTSAHFGAASDEGTKWFLELYPNGKKEGRLSLFFFPANSSSVEQELKVSYIFSFFNSADVELYSTARYTVTFLPSQKYGYGLSNISRASLNSVENLVVCCKLEYSKVVNLESPCSQYPSSVNQDLAHFFPSMDHSDVTFVIGHNEFPAHKAFLSVRSPVFAAMFPHDLKEDVPIRVVIDGIKPDIFRLLLRFIYSERVDLNFYNCKSLLPAAHRYKIGLLKWRCESFLIQDLKVENSCELLILADAHDAPNLRKNAAELIRKS